ncbi:MAG: hypothetical protein QOK28_926 [Actinomycetota bacterium]
MPKDTAGSFMLRPAPVACLAALVINDHWIKSRYPGFVTGKVSDVVGIALLTYVLVAVADVVARLMKRRLTLTALVVIAAVPAIGFALVKLSPPIANAYGGALGALRHPLGNGGRVRVTHDASDIFALVGSLIAGVDLWFVLKTRGA